MAKKVYPISDASGAYNDASCDRHNIVWSSAERHGRPCPACKAEEKLYRLEKKLTRLKQAAKEYIESSGKLARMEKYEQLAAALKGEMK